jgi:hypothetical protein
MQTIVIEIPLDHYDGFVDRCDPWSRHHTILKNGIIVRRRRADHFERFAEIHCTVHEAKGLLDRAEHVYPEVAPHIKSAITRPRDS